MPLVTGLDHFVLTVSSIEETCDFYGKALGMEVVTFAGGRKALLCGHQKINLHEVGREFEPKADRPTPGSSDFCLITKEDLGTLAARLASLGIAIEEGPVARTGARGSITSLYLRDPDGNLVEVARYDG
jgi:catechol 2,3-dioxygenase-like lactoylglutathione lyase family enzyme